MKEWGGLRLILWMWLTQRNGRGPRKFLGLVMIEWVLLAMFSGAALVGYWLLFKLYVSMTVLFWVRA